MGKLSTLKTEKPWALLGISRRQYEAAKPWKEAGVSRRKFEEIVRMAPSEVIKDIGDEAHADKLVKAMFGGDSLERG